MIQRIQSLYLLLMVIFSACLFFTAIAFKIPDGNAEGTIYVMDSKGVFTAATDGIKNYSYQTYIAISLNALLLLIALYCIMLYKKRVMQMKLCRLMLVLEILLVVLIFYATDNMFPETAANYKTIYWAGAYIPVANLILIYLSRMAIKKDNDLVRSVDRIR